MSADFTALGKSADSTALRAGADFTALRESADFTALPVVALGEALVDLIETPEGLYQACAGGSIFNFARGVARQGQRTCYLNPLSQDAQGRRFAALLAEDGVAMPLPASQLPTSLAFVSLDGDGVPSYAFYREGVADRAASLQELQAALPAALACVHSGGLALAPQDLPKVRGLADMACARGAFFSLDANLRPQAFSDRSAYVAGIQSLMRQAHVLKLSDEDIEALGWGHWSSSQLHSQLFSGTALHLFAHTHGAAGATLYTAQHSRHLPAPAGLQVVDTVGAGDCFMAGLLAYLLREQANLAALSPELLRGALSHAIAAASLNVQRTGCQPPSWDETAAFSATSFAVRYPSYP